MFDLIVVGLLVVLTVGLLLGIVTGKFSSKGNNFAALTSFHDFQPKDKQDAVEVIVDDKAGKNWQEQTSGQDKKKSKDHEEHR